MTQIAAFLLLLSALRGQSPIFYANAIIPQMPVGCGFNTSIILLNPAATPVSFSVNFWPQLPVPNSNATPVPRRIPIQGSGSVATVSGTVAANGTYVITTNGDVNAQTGCNGWTEVDSERPLGGYVVLTQTTTFLANQLVVSATVPLSSRFANRFLVPFDTTTGAAGIALVNPSFQVSAQVAVTYNDNLGIMICQETRNLHPGEQQVYSLSPTASNQPVCANPGDTSSYTVLQGKAGVVQFTTANLELSGFALGFPQSNVGLVSFPAQIPIGQ